MKNASNALLGGILIVIGVLFLGNNFDWFSFNIEFKEVARWWPLLLIFAGIGVFLNPYQRFSNPLTIIMIAFSIPLALFTLVNKGKEAIESKIEEKLEFDDNFDNSEQTNSYKKENSVNQTFSIPNKKEIKEVSLKFDGGAANFGINEIKNSMFDANSKLQTAVYQLEDEVVGTTQEIKFELKDKKNEKEYNFDEGSFDEEVTFGLNPNYLWNFKLGIGAGELNYDLSNYKVKDFDLETGVAKIQLKFGDLLPETNVSVKSGVAKVKFEIPEKVGCSIKVNGELNKKEFVGFVSKGNGVWETTNYEKADKKINITFKSELSSLTVQQY